MLQPEKIIISNGDINLQTSVYFKELEETIILLHGGPGVPDNMPEVVRLFEDRFRVITFYQRGIGVSKCKNCEYTMEAYISDLNTIANYFNLNTFHLFGHSWGGLYAQIYAEKRPEKIKSLFLCSPGSGTGDLWKQTEKEVLQHNKGKCSQMEWIGMGLNSLLGLLGNKRGYQKLIKQVLINYNKGYSTADIDESLINLIQTDPLNKTKTELLKYKALDIINNPGYPVQITYGDDDIYGESQSAVINRYPGAKVSIIKNSGHLPWKHNLPEFSKLVNEFYFLTT